MGYLYLRRIFFGRNRAQILLYHRVVADDTPPFLLSTLSGELVRQQVFKSHLDWLRRRYQICSLDDLLKDPNNKNKLAITFDDGFVDNHTYALPALEETPATIFMIQGSVGDMHGMREHRIARWLAAQESLPPQIEPNLKPKKPYRKLFSGSHPIPKQTKQRCCQKQTRAKIDI
ncbi:MAG: polysaccharide deacetylase family protein [Pseudomonadales bacterium]|nr:polysaccharide deacetylase family protein [Pseudomonadales bacterium]